MSSVGLLLLGAAAGCSHEPPSLEEQAVAHFETLGGRVVRNEQGRPIQLYLSGTGVTDDDFADVVHLADLRHIEIVYVPLTDASLQHLLPLKKLQYVDMSFTRITPKAKEQFQRAREDVRVTYAEPKRYDDTLPTEWTKAMKSTTRRATPKPGR
jgi:hypothetical protein